MIGPTNLYTFCFDLGFLGLLCMVVLGMGRGGHAGHHAARGPDTHGQAGTPHGPASHVPGPHVGHGAHSAGSGRAAWMAGLLSPRVWFSLLLGFGASGILFKALLPHAPLLLLGSVIGAVMWERLLVAPIFNLCMGFASKPGRTLETAVAEEAVAVTHFDKDGCGLISIVLDGHEVRILGRLCPADRAAEREVHGGDRLFVEAVDTKHNSCTVSVLNGIGPAGPLE